jgi:RHS repeat-associated protein
LDPDPVTNRVTASGALYDTRGNLTKFGIEGFTFDALNRIAVYQSPAPPLNPTVTWRYVHSATNERIVRLPSAGPYTYTLRDQQNRVVSEYEGAPTRDNIYLGNLLVGSFRAGEGWRFYSSDHLGSTRLSTTIYGSGEALKYWPFGEEFVSTTSSQRTRFAAMERDTESAQYYDHARSHGFQVGRFLSPDVINGNPSVPQSWNRYTYARNNPVLWIDPDGKRVLLPQDREQRSVIAERLSTKLTLKEQNALSVGAKGFLQFRKGFTSTSMAGKHLQDAIELERVIRIQVATSYQTAKGTVVDVNAQGAGATETHDTSASGDTEVYVTRAGTAPGKRRGDPWLILYHELFGHAIDEPTTEAEYRSQEQEIRKTLEPDLEKEPFCVVKGCGSFLQPLAR